MVEEGSADIIPGVDLPAVVDVVTKPTGVDMGGTATDPSPDKAVFDDATFDTAFEDGLEHQAVDILNEPQAAMEAVPHKERIVACNAHYQK
jgi:hypothetical protein